MAPREVTTFTRETANGILRAIRDQRRTPKGRLPSSGDWPGSPAREIRWGKTTTNYDYPTYPTSGGVYVVQLGDYVHSDPTAAVPGTAPTKTWTAYDPADYVIAVDPNGGTWAENSYVRLERHEGEWWIRPASTTVYPTIFSLLAVKLSSGKSYVEDGYPAALYPTNGFWVTENGVEVNTSPADETDWNFRITATGAYRFHGFLTWANKTTGTREEETITTTTASGHTHDVNVPRDYGIAPALTWKYRATGASPYTDWDTYYFPPQHVLWIGGGQVTYQPFSFWMNDVDADTEFNMRVFLSYYGTYVSTTPKIEVSYGSLEIMRLGDSQTDAAL